MSTNTENLNIAFSLLEQASRYYPRNKIIRELGLVVDRIKFSPELQELFIKAAENDSKSAATVTVLFKKEVSEEIFNFLDALADAGILEVLIGTSGKDFLEFAHKNLYQAREIFFISAVGISKKMKAEITEQIIMTNEDANIRVIFDENPYLVAGFVIQDDNKILDYTFKTNVINYLRTFFRNKLESIR